MRRGELVTGGEGGIGGEGDGRRRGRREAKAVAREGDQTGARAERGGRRRGSKGKRNTYLDLSAARSNRRSKMAEPGTNLIRRRGRLNPSVLQRVDDVVGEAGAALLILRLGARHAYRRREPPTTAVRRLGTKLASRAALVESVAGEPRVALSRRLGGALDRLLEP